MHLVLPVICDPRGQVFARLWNLAQRKFRHPRMCSLQCATRAKRHFFQRGPRGHRPDDEHDQSKNGPNLLPAVFTHSLLHTLNRSLETCIHSDPSLAAVLRRRLVVYSWRGQCHLFATVPGSSQP